MKVGDKCEIVLEEWLAKKNSVGTLLAGTIVAQTDRAVRVEVVTVLRQPPASGDSIPCRLCHRPLTEEASRSIGYGPDCAVSLGLGNKFIRDLRRSLTRDEVQAAEKATRQVLWLPLSKITLLPFGMGVVKEAEAKKEQAQARREAVAEVRSEAKSVALNMQHLEVSDEPMEIPLPIGFELRPYQWRGVRFMVDQRRVLNADLMGLGKSVMGALFMLEATRRLMEEGRDGPCAVVCPPVMVLTWKRELERWWQGVRVQTLKGYTAKIDPKADVYVLPWSILASGYEPRLGPDGKPLTQLIKTKDGSVKRKIVYDNSRVVMTKTALGVMAQQPSVIVGDESHKIKGERTQVSLGMQQFVMPASYVALMSGTFVLNRANELGTPLEVLDLLDTEFGGKDKFETEFCNKQLTWQGIKGGGRRKVFKYLPPTSSMLIELHKRLTPHMIRRRTEDVIKDMPPMTLSRVVVELSNREEYDDFEQEIAELPPMERLGKLSQLRQLCGIGKIPAMIEWIENFLECDEKLVVFATHRAVQRALLERFEKHNPAVILGQSEGGTVKKNQAQMDRFQQEPSCLLAICSTGAAREGITLTAAANLLMTELEWVPGVMDQAWKRVHRIGQKDPVTIWNLAAEESMDDTLMEKMATKRIISGEILDGRGEVLEEQLIKQAVIGDLVRRVSRRKKRSKKEAA